MKNVNTTTFRGIYDDYNESGVHIQKYMYTYERKTNCKEKYAKKKNKQKTKNQENKKTKTNIINNYAIYLLYN